MCRQLGLSTYGYAVPNAGFGEGTGAVQWDDVVCKGTETQLSQCKRAAPGKVDCPSHKEDVSGVQVARAMPLELQKTQAVQETQEVAENSGGAHSLAVAPAAHTLLGNPCRWASCAAAVWTPKLSPQVSLLSELACCSSGAADQVAACLHCWLTSTPQRRDCCVRLPQWRCASKGAWMASTAGLKSSTKAPGAP